MIRSSILKFLIALGIICFVQSFNKAIIAQNYNERDVIISVDKIWDIGQHNAFTSLIIFKDKFYVAFREGSGHVSYINGTIRVLCSEDGQNWSSVAHLDHEGVDLRDAQLSVTPDNRIMLNMGGSVYFGDDRISMSPLVSFSDTNGYNFSNPSDVNIDPKIKSNDDWLWKVTWNKGIAYSIIYQVVDGGTNNILVKSRDGLYYEYVSTIDLSGSPNETALIFDNSDKMIALIRRGGGNSHGYIGISSPPYEKWLLNEMGVKLGGPNLIYLPNGKIIVGTREYKEDHTTRMVLGIVDLNGYYKKLITLPSGGDCSYPGLIIRENIFYVSYYSSHEQKTSIYFAKLRLNKLMELTKKEIAPSPTLLKNRNGIIELSTKLENAEIKYTLDGTTPSSTHGISYRGQFKVNLSKPLKAVTIHPDYLESSVLTSTVGEDIFLDPISVDDELKSGLRYNYFLGEFSITNELHKETPTRSGIIPTVSIDQYNEEKNFGYHFDGYIKIPQTGIYTFYLSSNDGSLLKLNDYILISNDGPHAKRELSSSISLKKGIFKISIAYFQLGGNSNLELYWQNKDLNKSEIPANAYFHLP